MLKNCYVHTLSELENGMCCVGGCLVSLSVPLWLQSFFRWLPVLNREIVRGRGGGQRKKRKRQKSLGFINSATLRATFFFFFFPSMI